MVGARRTRGALFPAIGTPGFLDAIAADPRFAIHEQRAPRAPARTIEEFEEGARAACPSTSKSRSNPKQAHPTQQSQREFELSLQQSFVQYYLGHLTPYRSLLLFHKPGAGKTCAAITVALDHLRASRGNGAGKVLVLASSALQSNFRRQIFDDARFLAGDGMNGQCTRDAYLRMVPPPSGQSDTDGAAPESDRNDRNDRNGSDRNDRNGSDRNDRNAKEATLRRVARLIKTHFVMQGYEEFASTLEAMTDEEVASKYSNKLVVIDEAHNLRPSFGDKRTSVQVARLAAIGKNNRLLLLTATPMYDAAREIVYLLNLCRTNDGKPPIPAGPESDDPAVVGPASAGYVSYALSVDPLVFPARVVDGNTASYPSGRGAKKGFVDFYGKPFRGHTFHEGFRVVACPMSTQQRTAYEAAQQMHQRSDESDEEDGANGANVDDAAKSLLRSVQVSNIAFPGATQSAGRPGFTACIRGGPWAGGFSYAPNAGAFLAPAALPKWSAKLDAMARAIDAVKDGPVLAFSEYLYAGVLSLAIALEHRGWTREGGPPLLSPEAAALGGSIRVSTPGVKKKRYVLITGDYRFTPDLPAAVAIVNASSNTGDGAIDGAIDGVNVGVIAALVTSVAGEGVDFRGVREVHLMEPWYNASKLDQVVGRAVRACSHAHLPIEKRLVTVRYYAATVDGRRESSDLCMYRLAEGKAQHVADLEAALRAHAVDCALFKTAGDTVDPALTLRMIDARGETVEVRPGATGQAQALDGRCRASLTGPPPSGKRQSVVPFPEHLVPRAAREVKAALLERAKDREGGSTLADVLAAVTHRSDLPREVYFDALGRLVASDVVRFDDGVYSIKPQLAATRLRRRELLPEAPAAPLSPLSPIDPTEAFARAMDRLGGRNANEDGLEYEALKLSRAEASGAALRFLVDARPLTPLERRVRTALEKQGGTLVNNTFIDWAASPIEAWRRGGKGGRLEAASPPQAHIDAVRTGAVARLARWNADKVTYGFLTAQRPRRGVEGAAETVVALKLVRFTGRENRQTGFVCEQTSQFRAQDAVAEIEALGGKRNVRHDAKVTGRHSKRRLCDELGAALLRVGRLLTPLESVLAMG